MLVRRESVVSGPILFLSFDREELAITIPSDAGEQRQLLGALAVSTRTLADATTADEIATTLFERLELLCEPTRVAVVLLTTDARELTRGDTQFRSQYETALEQTMAEETTRYLEGDETDDDESVSVALLAVGGYGAIAVEGYGFDDDERQALQSLVTVAELALERIDGATRLDAQNRHLEEFASLVSHDLRNPLTTALGYLEVYRESADPTHADEIEYALHRIDDLAEELLILARYGQLVETFEAVSLEAAVNAAWDAVTTESTSDVRLEIGADVDGVVQCDRKRFIALLEQVFQNSVDHGSKRQIETAPDVVDGASERPVIAVTVERTPTGFAIADDGRGIPAEEKPAVFDLGYTFESDGKGYGLYIVQQITTAHGWQVRLTDSDSGGTRIVFSGVTFDA